MCLHVPGKKTNSNTPDSFAASGTSSALCFFKIQIADAEVGCQLVCTLPGITEQAKADETLVMIKSESCQCHVNVDLTNIFQTLMK